MARIRRDAKLGSSLAAAYRERTATFGQILEAWGTTPQDCNGTERELAELATGVHEERLRDLYAALDVAEAIIRRFRSYYIADHRLGGQERENTEIRDADAALLQIYRVGR